MASEIRVNNIKALTGLGTVTISSDGINVGAGINTANNFTCSLTGTAATATASATAYGISGTPTLSGITSVSTTNLTVNGSAYPSAGPLSNINLIINGAMQVAQRGTSTTGTSYGTVDRFRSQPTSGTVTQSQESLTSGDPYDEGFRYFFRTTNTTAGSNDATEEREIRYYVEAQDLVSSGWNYTSSTSYLTLSFWVRSSLAGTYYNVTRSLDGTGQNYTFSYTLTADTWTKVTHTIPGNSNITIDNDNGVGLQANFMIDLGTDHTDSGHTLDTWAAFSGTSRTPDFGQDWAGTTNATFDVTGVQLEVGSVATPFEHRSYGDELDRCERYFQLVDSFVATGYGSGVGIGMALSFRKQMRASPSLSVTGVLYVSDTVASDYVQSSVTGSIVSSNRNERGCRMAAANFSGLTDYRTYQARPGLGGEIQLSAEL